MVAFRPWQNVFIDLHYYGYWSCQLALLAGLRRIYEDFCQPGYQWPNADLVVRHLSHTAPATLSASHKLLLQYLGAIAVALQSPVTPDELPAWPLLEGFSQEHACM